MDARYKAEIRASRVLGTRALAGALARLDSPPSVLVAASAIGWYGDTGRPRGGRVRPGGEAFLARVVRDWEAAARPAGEAGIRVVNPRSGLVLARPAACSPGCSRSPGGPVPAVRRRAPRR